MPTADEPDFTIPVRPHRIDNNEGADTPSADDDTDYGFTFAGHTSFVFTPVDDLTAATLADYVETVLAADHYEYGRPEEYYYHVADQYDDYTFFHALVEPASGLGPYVMVSCRTATTEASVERFWSALTDHAAFTCEKNVTRNVDPDYVAEYLDTAEGSVER